MMAAKSVTLTASSNNKTRVDPGNSLNYISPVHSFKFFSEVNSINFRVGADVGLKKGIYYIDWSKTETKHSSSSADHYHAPAKTKVEVIAATANKWTFSVDGFTNQNTYIGHNSPDIALSVANAPFSDVTVTLSVAAGANENIVFEPATLLFNSENTTRYF